MALAGIVLQLIVSGIIGVKSPGEGIQFQIYEKFNVSISKAEGIVVIAVLVVGVITQLLGIFAQRTVPVTGTIYSVTEGYFISFLVFKVLGESGYAYLGLEALLLAALFLISDFGMIDRCVQEGYPKEYEWYCAFGLVFTVLWIYLKILDLLMQFVGKKDD